MEGKARQLKLLLLPSSKQSTAYLSYPSFPLLSGPPLEHYRQVRHHPPLYSADHHSIPHARRGPSRYQVRANQP